MNRLKTLASSLLIAVLLIGCTSLIYNKADWWIPWYVDDLVDISRDQKAELREALTPFLEWHRNEELERYLVLIDGVEADLRNEVTAAGVRRWFEQGVEAIERVESRMLDVSIEFGEDLSDGQMQEFMANLWEKQEEFEEEFLPRTDEEYEQDSIKYMTEFMERFTGRLTGEQNVRFELAASVLIRFDKAWLDDRSSWLKTIEPLMLRPQGWQQAVREAYDKREARQNAEYRRIFEHNLLIITAANADVLNMRTEKQDRKLFGELEDWRQKIRKLITQD